MWKVCLEKLWYKTNYLRNDPFLFQGFQNILHCQERLLQHFLNIFTKKCLLDNYKLSNYLKKLKKLSTSYNKIV